MINHYQVCALIPARGGSKRIPHKNIKELVGKPLLWYTASEAKKSKYIDRCLLSSDDPEIIELAEKYDVEVPFVRPNELAGDDVTDFPVFEHAVKWLGEHEEYRPDIIVQLRVTSPLRTVAEIDQAIELLAVNPEADSVRTVAEPEQSPYKMYRINDRGHLEPVLIVAGLSESFNLSGQKLPKAYKHVGYVDVMWRRTLVEKHQMTGSKIIPLILQEAHSGINTLQDWERYEFLMQKRLQPR